MKKIIYIYAISAILIVSALAGYFFLRKDLDGLRVVFLDVGQGDSVFIRPDSGQNILIDGGPDNTMLGELPRYMKWWDKTIDLMILTHPHDDHVFGLIEAAKRYKVKNAVYSGVAGDSPVFEAWKNTLAEKNIPVFAADEPITITLDSNCSLKIIPTFYGNEKNTVNLNDSSLVSLLDCENERFLFTGDIEERGEVELMSRNDDLRARVIKAGHHGSNTSSSEAFLDFVSPEYAVISSGAENKFGHPSLRVISRLERKNIKIFRTDLDGSVIFEVKDGEFSAR